MSGPQAKTAPDVSPVPAATPAKPDLAAELVASCFSSRNGVLHIGEHSARKLADIYGTPLFAYDAALMRANYRSLSEVVAGFAEVYYSVKANPRAEIAEVFLGEGAGLEIASIAEFRMARAAGCAPDRIIFAGPGKGEHELAEAINGGIGEIHLESLEEIEHCARLARHANTRVNVSIRVNPVAGAQGGAMRMGGKPTAFGFDEEDLDAVAGAVLQQSALNLQGVHLFAGTQLLDADVLAGQWQHGLNVASRLADLIGGPLKSIDLGGGLGVPYHSGDASLDLDVLGARMPGLRQRVANDPGLARAHIVLEPGRYLTANAGVYVMTVRAVKTSRGERFVICDGGMHHHLAASGNLGQVIKRDYPLLAADKLDESERFGANIVGPLCTPLDTLGRKTRMPALAQGNLVAVLQSGAYGLSASPTGFLSHPLPAEVLIDGANHKRIGADTSTFGRDHH